MGEEIPITIGMPVRNGGAVLRPAIESILSQRFRHFELVIADNASTDDTETICRSYVAKDKRVRYVRHVQNIGAAANFNYVFKQCNSPYFKWAAHDDVIAPDCLDRCLASLEHHTDAVLTFGRRRYLTPDGRIVPYYQSAADGYEVRWSYNNPSFGQLLRLPGDCFPIFLFGLIRTRALRKTRLVGAYPTADLVLAAELRLLGRFYEVPRVLYYQRHHTPDAEWRRRCTKEGEAAWYDPNGRIRRLPGMRCFCEHLRGIQRADVPWWKRWRAYAAMSCYWPTRVQRQIRSRTLWRRVCDELGFRQATA